MPRQWDSTFKKLAWILLAGAIAIGCTFTVYLFGHASRRFDGQVFGAFVFGELLLVGASIVATGVAHRSAAIRSATALTILMGAITLTMAFWVAIRLEVFVRNP